MDEESEVSRVPPKKSPRILLIAGGVLLFVGIVAGLFVTSSSHNAISNSLRSDLDTMCVGTSAIQSAYARGSLTDQQLLDQLKPLILAGYDKFTKAFTGGVDIRDEFNSQMMPAFAPTLLKLQVDTCALFKKKGY